MKIKELHNDQLCDFDREYVNNDMWEYYSCKFLKNTSKILDVGGGNGIFADKILKYNPNARVTIVDNAKILLDKNKKSERKILVCESIDNYLKKSETEKFDLITINWVLHHLITNNYVDTKELIVAILKDLGRLLSENGRIVVYENAYEGMVVNQAPGYIIYKLTSIQNQQIAKIFRRFGANTAGTGVCFRSTQAWLSLFADAGLHAKTIKHYEDWNFGLIKKIILNIRKVRVVLFELERIRDK